MKYLINDIIQQLEEVQNGKLWIGSTFDSLLKQVNEDIFFLRPNENLHSIAEVISHLTLWRKEAMLKIQTGKGSKTDDCEGIGSITINLSFWGRIISKQNTITLYLS
jgi:hypothetical protein